AVARAGRHRHRLTGTAARHRRDRGAAYGDGGELGRAAGSDADRLTERHREVEARRVGRSPIEPADGTHYRRRLVDGEDWTPGDAGAGTGAAEWVARRVGDGVVVDQVEADGAVARAGRHRHRVTGTAARHRRDRDAAGGEGE